MGIELALIAIVATGWAADPLATNYSDSPPNHGTQTATSDAEVHPASVSKVASEEPASKACPVCGRVAHDHKRCFCMLFTETFTFALGRPYQYVPPGYAWTTIVPPLPPATRTAGDVEPTPAPVPWKPLLYDVDFRYLNEPDNRYIDFWDFTKQISPLPSGDLKIDFGGEFRWQGRVEDNRRLLGEQNNHSLFREILFLNAQYRDRVRGFIDVIWADSTPQTVPPVFFDQNHGDFLNAFGELKLFDDDDRTLSGRFGWKQQLLYGNHRLVSPLAWANSPRTFATVAQGVYRSPDWNIDGFWSRPNIVLANQLDQPNFSQQFFGTYAVYKALERQLLEFYYLALLETDPVAPGSPGVLGTFDVHTLGNRWQGQRGNFLWETELAYQFGHQADLPRSAGMATGGVGWQFADWRLRPELWFYYDYASGNRYPGARSFSTFNQLFPLGHKFFGYMDIVGRQNVLSPNVNMKFYLNDRLNLLFWYYNLQLASAQDALYNAAGQPIRFDPSGRAGRFIGNEFDIVLNLIQNPHADWQFGVSQFWAGTFIQRTAQTPAQAQNASFFYVQFTYRF